MPDIAIIDLAALVWFFLLWSGYVYYADRMTHRGHNLMTVMKRHRSAWMQQMLRRDMRMVDTTIMSALMRSVGLFSSITLLIIAGLLAIMGSLDKVQALVEGVPYLSSAPKAAWELKILLLILIFIYAFFKCAWSLRQFNYSITLVGAAPPPAEADTEDAQIFANGASELLALAVSSFNRAMRTYYFGLAALSWFLHPVLFMLATVWVIAVVYRREFRSQTLATLTGVPDMGDKH